MKLFKQCKCGTFCATGYCSECRAKDAAARTIKAREKMDSERRERIERKRSTQRGSKTG